MRRDPVEEDLELNLDDGYTLPELRVEWHELASDHSAAGSTRDGQGLMFRNAALGVQQASREKRDTIETRVAKALELVKTGDGSQWVIWCDLNDEQAALEEALAAAGISVSSLYGAQSLEDREALLEEWRSRKTTVFLSKPSMYGAGINLQQSHQMLFVGIGFRFAEVIQAIHRIHRFMQKEACTVHLIYTEAEREVRRELERKWAQHNELVSEMSALIRQYGLADATTGLTRAMGVDRREVKAKDFHIVNNDCVHELQRMEANSVGLILTSVPFSTQYEYSPNFADFGHSDNNEHFFAQMEFLIPQLLRVLQPGRICAIHVKDRIVPGGMTGLGFQTAYPFHADVIEAFSTCPDCRAKRVAAMTGAKSKERYLFCTHRFGYMGMKTIVTDVVRENNQTYRLGWTEQCKDGTKMGCGMPEYLLLFRKPPSDTSNSYADDPVVKDKPFCEDSGEAAPFDKRTNWKQPVPGTGYSRARWQMDAHAFERSSGSRLLTTDELLNLPHEQLFKLWRDRSRDTVYDFEAHVAVAEELDHMQRLPATFMLLPPHSWHPDVWSDVARMRTLNAEQYQRGAEYHLCPLQHDICERTIRQFSNPGDVVFDPFVGIGSVPYNAILLGRKGMGVELSNRYYLDAVGYCEMAVRKMAVPDLFDFLEPDTQEAA